MDNKLYNVLYKTAEQICQKAYKEQYKKFFSKKKRHPLKSITEQGFHFSVPAEAEYIIKELIPKALKNQITEDEVKSFRLRCIKLDLI